MIEFQPIFTFSIIPYFTVIYHEEKPLYKDKTTLKTLSFKLSKLDFFKIIFAEIKKQKQSNFINKIIHLKNLKNKA